jgi:hypothetical protein
MRFSSMVVVQDQRLTRINSTFHFFFLEKEKRKQNNIILIKEKSGFSTCRPPSGLELTIHQVNPLGRFQSKGWLLQN